MNLFISIFGKFFKEKTLYDDDNAQTKFINLYFHKHTL